jgi:hypothetical protein
MKYATIAGSGRNLNSLCVSYKSLQVFYHPVYKEFFLAES